MNDEQLIWNLYEANLFSKNPLHFELEKVLKEKNVTKQPIKDWFLKTYIKWFTSPNEDNLKTDFIQKYQAQESDPEWARKDDVMQFKSFTPQYLEKLYHIVDFLDTRDDNYLKSLYKVTIPQMDQAVQEWDEQMRAASEKAQKEKVHSVQNEDYYIVDVYDGYPVWGLKSNKAFREESLFMGHCVGQSETDRGGVKSLEGGESNYFKEYKKGNKRIYSLRDPSKNNQPAVTFEVSTLPWLPQNEVIQIKGKHNDNPDEKYWKACELFIRDEHLLVKEDGENIGMTYWQEKERFYFKKEFKAILKKYIIPQRNLIIEDIRKKMRYSSGNVYRGDIDLSNWFFDELPDLSDIIVMGHFSCSRNNLKNLKGSPRYVSATFSAIDCKLESLEGAPFYVGGTFNVSHNKIQSLDHSPNMVGGDYLIYNSLFNHQLKSLKGCSNIIAGHLRIYDVDTDLLNDLNGVRVQTVDFYDKADFKLVTLDEEGCKKYGIIPHKELDSGRFYSMVEDKIHSEIRNRQERSNNPNEDSEEIKIEPFKKFFNK